MKIEEIEKNKIFECITGSVLYGFSTPESDLDKRGVFIPTKDYVLGMKKIEQYESSMEDRVLYSIHKFFFLASNANPNIIELMYVPENKILARHSIWNKVRDNSHLFLSKKCKFSFAGYANAQLQRIERHKRWIDDPAEEPPKKEDYIGMMALRIGDESKFVQVGWDKIKLKSIIEPQGGKSDVGKFENAHMAELEYFRKDEYEAALKKHKQYLEWKKNRNPDRAKLEASYGYDGKHASHLIRLLKMGKEILEHGVIFVDREAYGDAQLYLDIRAGKYPYDKLIGMAKDLEAEIEELYETSKLQKSPDVNNINDLLVEVYEEYYSLIK